MVSVKKVTGIGELVPIENGDKLVQKRIITLEERTDFYFDKNNGALQVIHEQENAELFNEEAAQENIKFEVGDYIIADIRHSVNEKGFQYNTLRRYARLRSMQNQ